MIETKDCWMKDRCKLSGNCPDFCMKLFKMDFLSNQALLTNQQRKYLQLRLDADGTDREAFSRLKNIELDIQNFVAEGHSLFLHSRITGNSKTSWALRLLNTYLNKIWVSSDLVCRGLFINVPRFFISLKDSFSKSSDYVDHIKENVLGADLVVFDEIGVKALTSFEMEQLLSIVNARIDAGKSNIYTSNLSEAEMRESVGDRLYSRVVNNSVNIELMGNDKRGLI